MDLTDDCGWYLLSDARLSDLQHFDAQHLHRLGRPRAKLFELAGPFDIDWLKIFYSSIYDCLCMLDSGLDLAIDAVVQVLLCVCKSRLLLRVRFN